MNHTRVPEALRRERYPLPLLPIPFPTSINRKPKLALDGEVRSLILKKLLLKIDERYLIMPKKELAELLIDGIVAIADCNGSIDEMLNRRSLPLSSVAAVLRQNITVVKRKSPTPNWLAFEQSVATLLANFGYSVTHDTNIQGGQTDVFATSARRTLPDIIVECKFHEKSTHKVGISETQLFIARVQTLRADGVIDQGYLVTNTGFTSDARAALVGPAHRFVRLLTYQELLGLLLNLDGYLKDFVRQHAESGLLAQYIPLRTVDTSGFGGTIFEAELGFTDLLYRWTPQKHTGDRSSWIVPIETLNWLIDNGYTDRLANGNHMLAIARIKPLLEPIYKASAREPNIHRGRYVERHEAVVNLAKREFAQQLCSSIGSEAFIDDVEAELTHPPHLPEKLLKLLGLSSPPPGIRRVWERCLHQASIADDITVTHSEPAIAIPTEIAHVVERAATDIQLLPIASAIDDLQSFLSHPEQRLCILLGDYGAGKSTVLRYLMYLLATEKISAPSDPSVRNPLLLNLREYNKVADFYQLLRLFLADEAGVGIDRRTFSRLNADGHFVLLLDGFDEMLERVTKADRRRCFNEIAEYVAGKSKVILTGRPGYFPDHAELMEVLSGIQSMKNVVGTKPSEIRLKCLQLMDGHELDQFLERGFTNDVSQAARELIERNASLHDLARRPVLARLIVESASELQPRKDGNITIRDLYETYTNKWIMREQDKGRFRLLINPEDKSTFVRYLAMEMHISGRLSIHYRRLGEHIRDFFRLENVEHIDHFSSDVRTCSFLIRSDAGEYRFIHKSFMEYFVVCEFERLDDSPFAERFNKPLTEEMENFLSEEKRATRRELSSQLNMIRDICSDTKMCLIKAHDFEAASKVRDNEALMEQHIESEIKFSSMRKSDLAAWGAMPESMTQLCRTMLDMLMPLCPASSEAVAVLAKLQSVLTSGGSKRRLQR